MAFPVATTSDIWALSKTLSMTRVGLLALLSLVFLAIFIYAVEFRINVKEKLGIFTLRVIATYFLTIIVCTAILAIVDKFPVSTHPVIALKRCILVAFPASFLGTIIDSLD
jgi:uncharacterized membrane protein